MFLHKNQISKSKEKVSEILQQIYPKQWRKWGPLLSQTAFKVKPCGQSTSLALGLLSLSARRKQPWVSEL